MIVVVLHEPQDLVNIAHVVRGMKNFGIQDQRLVSPREYDAYRVEGIAHQTRDVLARVRVCATLDDALAESVHVVGFTARGRLVGDEVPPQQDVGGLGKVNQIVVGGRIVKQIAVTRQIAAAVDMDGPAQSDILKIIILDGVVEVANRARRRKVDAMTSAIQHDIVGNGEIP